MKSAKLNIISDSDKPELERKYRILGDNFEKRVHVLNEIYRFVLEDPDHFTTLDLPPHALMFDELLLSSAQRPTTIKPLHHRLYWSTETLSGYQTNGQAAAEFRTERILGKNCWEQVVKISEFIGKAKTLQRREISYLLDNFGINISILPENVKKPIKKILGNATLKPVACLQGQGMPVLYHPNGCPEIVCEIKFDLGIGHSFDGFKIDITEIEVEVKEFAPEVDQKEIEVIFDNAEEFLNNAFPGSIVSTTVSKPAPLFRHLQDWKAKDLNAFRAAYKALPLNYWAAPGAL